MLLILYLNYKLKFQVNTKKAIEYSTWIFPVWHGLRQNLILNVLFQVISEK